MTLLLALILLILLPIQAVDPIWHHYTDPNTNAKSNCGWLSEQQCDERVNQEKACLELNKKDGLLTVNSCEQYGNCLYCISSETGKPSCQLAHLCYNEQAKGWKPKLTHHEKCKNNTIVWTHDMDKKTSWVFIVCIYKEITLPILIPITVLTAVAIIMAFSAIFYKVWTKKINNNNVLENYQIYSPPDDADEKEKETSKLLKFHTELPVIPLNSDSFDE